jgi:hypothetical protein
MAAALVLAETIDGMTEAPAMDSPSTPRQACRVPELCHPSELLCYGSAGDTFRVPAHSRSPLQRGHQANVRGARRAGLAAAPFIGDAQQVYRRCSSQRDAAACHRDGGSYGTCPPLEQLARGGLRTAVTTYPVVVGSFHSGLDLAIAMFAPCLLGCPGTPRQRPVSGGPLWMQAAAQNGSSRQIPVPHGTSSGRRIE